MTEDKRKALMVYGLGVFTVVLCVGAAVFHRAYENCFRMGGTWGTFSCQERVRQGVTVKPSEP